MSNKQPKTEQIERYQFTRISDEPMSSKTFAVRLPQSVARVIDSLGQGKTEFIRTAIIEKVEREGLTLKSTNFGSGS